MACTCDCHHHGILTAGLEERRLETRVAQLEAELRARLQTERRSLEARVAQLEAELRAQGGPQPGPGES